MMWIEFCKIQNISIKNFIEKDLNEKFKWLSASFQWNTRDNEIVNRLLTNYFDYRILFKE